MDMNSRISWSALLLISVFLALPSAVYAGGIPFFGPIIPQGTNQAVCPASWGMLIDVINNIISFVITISIVFIAPIVIAYAGFLLVTGTGNPGAVTKAKGLITQVVVGIVVMLAAWLIVDAIMAVLYKPDANTGWTTTWSKLITSGGIGSCLEQAGALPDGTLNQKDVSNIEVASSSPPSDTLQESSIRQRFAAAGVDVNNDYCVPIVSSCDGTPKQGCTNLSNMKEDTINQVIALARAVKSTIENKYVVITGGTEPGHACGIYSHQNGYKVDLGVTEALSKMITTNNSSIGQRTGDNGGSAYTDKCGQMNGNEYVLESNPAHWDITVKGYCTKPF